MRPNAFIHSFERERERESAESLWSVVVASRRRTQTKTKKKRARFFVVVVVDAKTLVVLLKRQRESVWSQRRNTFFPSGMRDDFSTIHLVQRNKVAFIFTFAFGTEELLLVSEPSSSFPSSSKVVVIGDFNKGQKRLLRSGSSTSTLSLSLSSNTQIRERKVKK